MIRAVLIDLSGTLHVEDKISPGAVEALNRLRGTGLPFRFLTNTTKESKSCIFARLQRCGFQIDKEDIFTSLTAAKNYIDKKQLKPLLLLEEEALEDFEGVLNNSEEKNAVVVGLAPSQFNYETLNSSFKLLMKGADLIAIHKGRYYSRGDGLALGPGPFVTALEFATGKKATVVGKPEQAFFHSAIEEFGCDPKDVVMIGDDVRDDVEGALQAGLQAILVRTGKYRTGDENTSSINPTAVCNNFSEAVDYIIERS